jgi:class 3 adenylate cyclase
MMKCLKCQFENIEKTKFCGKCGSKLENICQNCKYENPINYEFCGQCGHDLTLTSEPLRKELSPDEKLEKIQKYFPQGIMEKILSQGDKIEGERRNVTVLFADIYGFTAISEKMDPEEVTGIMNKCFSMIGECIKKHEGTIDKFMGDCMMALFGAPIALEDAPQRAIRSAIMIHREMTKFNDRMKHEKETIKPLRMRIGIHTGPVVAGRVGGDGKQDFTVMGDTVNIASRMEGMAEPGTIFVTGDTFRLTEGIFRFEALGKKKIKGKEKPIQVYQVIAASTRRTRFDVSTERGLTPFLGRQRELELLIDGYERSKEGRGQAISIISEAGIGKSRLLYEFRKAVTNEDTTFLEGRCLSYSTNIAYHPIVDILRATFDIQDTDTDAEIRQKVTQFLKVLQIDEATHMPFLLELLAVKDSGINKIPMSPEARKDRTLEALKQITIKGSELRPLIMAIEDLHWMDRSSEDVLKNLLESIAGSRVFLIFTYRPEFVHTWGSRSYHSQIMLNKIGRASCRERVLAMV